MTDNHAQGNYVTAFEPDRSLQKIIGEDVDLNTIFTPEKIKACQKIIDEARNEFFDNELPKIDLIRSFLRRGNDTSFQQIEFIVNDMRSQARIFGFPFIALACSHIVSFCDDYTKKAETRRLIISKFVDLLYIALRNKVRDEGGGLEKEIARLLK